MQTIMGKEMMNKTEQRFEAAKAAMQGILSNGPLCHRIMDGDLREDCDITDGERIARIALHMADALISKLNNTDSNERLSEIVDKLLNHCPDSECSECSKISCPHGCELHFHHDGCPACAMASEPAQTEPTIKESLTVPDADGWVVRIPTDPIPERYAEVRFADGVEMVGIWSGEAWTHQKKSCDRDLHITHYRPA